jgi:hypothetical protein
MTLHSTTESGESLVSIGHRDGPGVPSSAAVSATVSVTCSVDARTHQVREIDIVPAARQGRYPTLCGETITAASMAEPDVRRCPRCSELRDDDVAPRPSGLLRRLVGR